MPNIIFIVPLAVNLSLSSIPRRRNWAVEPYLMYSAISSTLEFTLSWLLFLPPRQLNACWVLQIHCKDEKFPLLNTIIVHMFAKFKSYSSCDDLVCQCDNQFFDTFCFPSEDNVWFPEKDKSKFLHWFVRWSQVEKN